MSSFTEKVVPSALSASFHQAFVTATANEDWTTTTSSSSEASLVCTTLAEGVTIRVNPMARQYDGWNEAHFHSHLRLPMECSIAKGMVVTLEGKQIPNTIGGRIIVTTIMYPILYLTCVLCFFRTSPIISICQRMCCYCSFSKGLL
jgi:hypothetical protein